MKGIFDEKCSLFDWDKPPPVFLDSDDELEIEVKPESALSEGDGYEDDDDDEQEFGDLSAAEEDDHPF